MTNFSPLARRWDGEPASSPLVRPWRRMRSRSSPASSVGGSDTHPFGTIVRDSGERHHGGVSSRSPAGFLRCATNCWPSTALLLVVTKSGATAAGRNEVRSMLFAGGSNVYVELIRAEVDWDFGNAAGAAGALELWCSGWRGGSGHRAISRRTGALLSRVDLSIRMIARSRALPRGNLERMERPVVPGEALDEPRNRASPASGEASDD